jgi:hypothetical protein
VTLKTNKADLQATAKIVGAESGKSEEDILLVLKRLGKLG